VAEFVNLSTKQRLDMGQRAHQDALSKFTPQQAHPGLLALFGGNHHTPTKV